MWVPLGQKATHTSLAIFKYGTSGLHTQALRIGSILKVSRHWEIHVLDSKMSLGFGQVTQVLSSVLVNVPSLHEIKQVSATKS